jgi:hypothetical protein
VYSLSQLIISAGGWWASIGGVLGFFALMVNKRHHTNEVGSSVTPVAAGVGNCSVAGIWELEGDGVCGNVGVIHYRLQMTGPSSFEGTSTHQINDINETISAGQINETSITWKINSMGVSSLCTASISAANFGSTGLCTPGEMNGHVFDEQTCSSLSFTAHRLDLNISRQVGERVDAKWKGGSQFYAGTIAAVNRDGTFAVHYDDGDKDGAVAESSIKFVVPSMNAKAETIKAKTAMAVAAKAVV